MQTPSFAEKFIAFVDVLGFASLVDAAENNTGKSLPELLARLELLGMGGSALTLRNLDPRAALPHECWLGTLISALHKSPTALWFRQRFRQRA